MLVYANIPGAGLTKKLESRLYLELANVAATLGLMESAIKTPDSSLAQYADELKRLSQFFTETAMDFIHNPPPRLRTGIGCLLSLAPGLLQSLNSAAPMAENWTRLYNSDRLDVEDRRMMADLERGVRRFWRLLDEVKAAAAEEKWIDGADASIDAPTRRIVACVDTIGGAMLWSRPSVWEKPDPVHGLLGVIAMGASAPDLSALLGELRTIFLRLPMERPEGAEATKVETKGDEVDAIPIRSSVAVTRYHVEQKTLSRKVKDGALTDLRPPGHARNASLILDDRELERHFPRRNVRTK